MDLYVATGNVASLLDILLSSEAGPSIPVPAVAFLTMPVKCRRQDVPRGVLTRARRECCAPLALQVKTRGRA